MELEIKQNGINNQSKTRSGIWSNFDSTNKPKVTPKCLPKSSKNRSWGHLGTRYGPKMLQMCLRHRILRIVERLLNDLLMIWARLCDHFDFDFWDHVLNNIIHVYSNSKNHRLSEKLFLGQQDSRSEYNFGVLNKWKRAWHKSIFIESKVWPLQHARKFTTKWFPYGLWLEPSK